MKMKLLTYPVAGLALIFFLGGPPQPAMAGPPAWVQAMIQYVLKMRLFMDFSTGTQLSPPLIPRLESDPDPSGVVNTYQPGGPTVPAFNAFFQNLGTNGRTCFTCHQPATGWTVSAASVQARFVATSGTDPIFRLVDGATCSSDNVSILTARSYAYRLLTGYGLIRIALPLPANAEFTLVTPVGNDPDSCQFPNSPTGIDPTTGGPMLSMYRRPLPATNLTFVPGLPSTTIPSAIMWDGREPSLENQSVDATLGHAQANNAPSGTQQAQIVGFEKGLFTAQSYDVAAGLLAALNATGGAVALSAQTLGTSTPDFNLYLVWASQTGARLSIARGENLFNGTVPLASGKTAPCSGCHNDANVGNHATEPFFINLNTAGDPGNTPEITGAPLDVSGLPVFTFQCSKQGSDAGDCTTGSIKTVTDPGVALRTGLWNDIGKFKVPGLRGLASRAPYFHNGSAATLASVVNFYNLHFSLNMTAQEQTDLVNFLNAL
jgi:cytochrome c peroxidase